MNLLADLRAVGQLWRVLRAERPDILHTHNPKPGVYGRIVGRLARVPIVINTVHGLYATPDSSLLKRVVVYGLEWLASRFSDAELIQSPEDFDLLWRARIMPRSKLRLLGNGVDLDRFRPNPELRRVVREELGLSEDQIAVGLVARLVEEKGVPELIEAARALGDRFVVLIVGPPDPEKSDALPEALLTRAEADGVRFLGMRQDVERVYQGLDIFVLPSHREGFPRAAMEAAASGLPVIASDIRGCRQVVEDGVNGFLFPVKDVAALTEAISRIGDDDALRSSMSLASVDRARVHFDERQVVEKVMGAYADVAAAKGRYPELVARWGGSGSVTPG
jgi:glycosyltransferase involved in cell wall biosynthesis